MADAEVGAYPVTIEFLINGEPSVHYDFQTGVSIPQADEVITLQRPGDKTVRVLRVTRVHRHYWSWNITSDADPEREDPSRLRLDSCIRRTSACGGIFARRTGNKGSGTAFKRRNGTSLGRARSIRRLTKNNVARSPRYKPALRARRDTIPPRYSI